MAKTLPTLSFDKELTDKQKSALAEADKQVKAEKLIGGTAPRQARTNNEAEKASERAAIEKAKAKQLAKNAGQAFTNRQQNAAKNIVQNAGQELAGKQTAEKQDSPLVNQGKKAVERVTGRAGQKLTDEQIALGLVTKDPALSVKAGAGIIGRQAERKARFEQAAKSAELESERQKQVIEAQRQANEEYKRRFVEPIETAKKDADDAAKAYQDALNMWVAASRGGNSKDEVDELWKQAESWKYYAMTKAQEYTRIHKQAQEEAKAWEEARAEAARQAAARQAKLEYDLEQARMRQAETGRQLAPMLVREAGERLRQTGPETYGFGDYAEMPAARRTADIIRAAAYGNMAGYANAVGMLDPYAEAVSQDEGSILAGNYRVPQMRTAGQAHMQSLARQWDELGRTSLERAKADLSTGGQVAVEIGVAALQMLGDIAITQGRGTLYAMTVRAGGGYAMEAARDGASQNEQFVYGLAGGAVEAATEKIFAVAPLFKRIYGKGIVNTSFTDDAVKALSRLAKSPTGKAIVDRAAHGLLAMTSEGAEEVLADFMEPVIRKATYDRDSRISWDLEQMLHDGIIGAALGGLGVPGIIARSGQVRSGYELDEALDKYQAAIIEHGILSDEARDASMNVWRMTGKLSTQDVAKAVSERLAVDPEAAAKEPGVRYWLAKGRETERAPAEEAEPVMPEAETQRIEDEEAAPAEPAAPAVGEAAPPATDVAPSPLRRGGFEDDVPAPVLPGVEELRTQEAERAPVEAVNEDLRSELTDRAPVETREQEEVPAPVLPGMEELRTQGVEETAPPATDVAPSPLRRGGLTEEQGEPLSEVPAPVLPGVEELSGGSRAAAGDVLRLQSGAEFEIIATDAEGVTLDATDEAGRHGHISWGNLAKMQDAGQITITRSGENGTLPDRGRYGESGGRAGGQTEGLRPGGELGQTAAERVRAADRGRALSSDNGQRAPLVSGREIGLRNGSDTKAARIIPEHRWKDSGHMGVLDEIRAAGYEPIPFTGTVYVEVAGRRTSVDGFRFEKNGRRYIGVKMDSTRLSPRQIARHELAHEEYVRQPLMVRAVWDRLTADGDESFYNLLEDYVQGLHSMYGEELERYMEEIFCDAQAGISRRYAPMNERLRGHISETAGQVRQEYADATEGRGPPEGKAGERYSAEDLSAGDRLILNDGVYGEVIRITDVRPDGAEIVWPDGEADFMDWKSLNELIESEVTEIEKGEGNGLVHDRGRRREFDRRAGEQTDEFETEREEQNERGRNTAAREGSLPSNNGEIPRGEYISARELRILGGTNEKEAVIIPEERWREFGIEDVCSRIRAAGAEPMPFTGRFWIKTPSGRRKINGFYTGRYGRPAVAFKADDPRSEKIAIHELSHMTFRTQPRIVEDTWDSLQDAFTDDRLHEALVDYMQAWGMWYGEDIMPYVEELFCDIRAGMAEDTAALDVDDRETIRRALENAIKEASINGNRASPEAGGERYSAEDEEVPAPVLPGLEDIAGAADEKRAAAAARVSDSTLKNNIRERRRQIEDIENLIGGGEANPGQARKLETLRKELAAYEAELKKRTAAKPKKPKNENEKPKDEARPAPYADPLNDKGEGKGSAQEAVKAAETAEKAERKKGRKKTAKPHRAAAETAKKLVGLFAVEKEDRARAEQLVMDALVRYAQRGRMSTGEVRELVDGLFALGTVEGEVRNEEAEDFRKQMRRRRIYVSDELKSEFGEDYEALRKRAFSAGIYFVKDKTGMAPDMVNSELAEAYPGFFDEGETDMGAVLEKIVSIAEEGQAERLSMEDFLQTLAETNTDYARDYARETEAKVRQYLLEFAKNFKLEAAMDRYWQGQVEGRAREKAREQIIKDRAKRGEQRHAAAQWRQEQRERKAVFEAVRRAARLSRKVNLGTLSEMEDALREVDLDRLQAIKPTDRSAEEEAKLEIASARAALAEAIGGIDILSRRLSNQGIENRETLAEDYRKLKEELGDNFIPLKGIEERVGQLSKKQIDEMSIDEVRELGKTIASAVTEIENGQKLLSDMREQSLQEAAAAARRDIEGTKGFRAKRKHKEVNPVTKLLAEGQLSPGRVMSMIGGWRDAGVWEDFRRIFEEATDREMRFRDEADRLYASFSDESHEDYKERRKWLESSYGRKAKWEKLRVEIYDPDAVVENMERKQLPTTFADIEITPMMKVALYLHAQNDDNLNHIAVGGIVIPYKKLMQDGKVKAAYEEGNSQRLRITPAAMKAIARDVKKDKYAYEFAKLMHKYTDEVSKDAINGVSLAVEGFERAAVKNYWPIESAKDFVGGGPGSWGDYASVENIGSIANERVPRAGNPIMLFDAVETFQRQKDTVAKYAAYTIPLRDWDALMAYNFHRKGGVAFESTMRKVIEGKWGKGVNEYFDQMEKDLSFKMAPDKIEFMSKLRGNFASAWLSFNASVAVSQAAAYPTALPYIGLDGMASGLRLWNKVDSELIGKYTGVLAYREGTGFSPEAMDFLKTNNAFARLMKKHPELNWPEQMDTFWIKRLWAACEYRVAKDTDLRPGESPKSGEDPYYRAVADLFRKAVFDTQYNSSTFQRPGLLRRDNEIIKLVTMFKTDAMQHYNMIFEAAGRLGRAQEDYKAAAEEDKAEAGKRVRRARESLASNIAAVIGSEVLWSTIKGGFKVLRGSAGAFATGAGAVTVASFAKGVAALTADSLAGSVLFGEEALQFAAALVDALIPDDDDDDKVKTQYYGIELNVISEIADFAQDIVYLGDSIGKKDNSWRKRSKDIAISLLEMAGVPAGGVTRDFEGILRKAFPEGKYALDNFWKELKKADLAKIPDAERAAAISVLIGNRAEISDEAAAELARLYGADYKKAVPAALPTKYTVDGEEKALNTTQLNAYKDAWGGAVAGQLEKLIKSPAYTSADDAGREKMINMLYDYAGGLAKEAAVDVAPADWISQSRELVDSGKMSLTDIIAYRAAGGKLDSAIKYMDEGMSAEGAITAAGVLGELEPEDGKSQVSNGQKLMALGTELGDQKDKDAAAHKILSSESAVAKYDEAMKAGITTYEYGACLSAIGGVKPHEGRQEANQWQKVMALDDALTDQKDVQTAAKTLILDGSTAEEYEAAIKAGFSSYEYAEMQDGFTTVEPHEGRKEASYDQKLDVIVKTISPHRQVEAAKAITESEEGKANLDKVIDAGISLSTYADYQEALNVTYAHDDVDESGEKVKDSRKKHMFEYVSGLPLTAQQKSALIGTKYAESTVEKERLW